MTAAIGEHLNGIAFILLAVAVLVVALAVLLLVSRRGFQRFEGRMDAKIGKIGVTLEGVEKKTTEIVATVNNVPDGTPTLSVRVDQMVATVDQVVERVDLVLSNNVRQAEVIDELRRTMENHTLWLSALNSALAVSEQDRAWLGDAVVALSEGLPLPPRP